MTNEELWASAQEPNGATLGNPVQAGAVEPELEAHPIFADASGRVSNFEPGPWEVEGAVVRSKRNAHGGGGFFVADCLRAGSREVVLANAQLIAAAPDLLFSLQMMVDKFECMGVFSSVCESAKEAIAKAEAA